MDERYTKERYFIAALLVPGDAANDGIVRRAHRSYDPVPRDAELHGYDIVAGKGDWAGLAGQGPCQDRRLQPGDASRCRP